MDGPEKTTSIAESMLHMIQHSFGVGVDFEAQNEEAIILSPEAYLQPLGQVKHRPLPCLNLPTPGDSDRHTHCGDLYWEGFRSPVNIPVQVSASISLMFVSSST